MKGFLTSVESTERLWLELRLRLAGLSWEETDDASDAREKRFVVGLLDSRAGLSTSGRAPICVGEHVCVFLSFPSFVFAVAGRQFVPQKGRWCLWSAWRLSGRKPVCTMV
jgi:hypothetical protein